VHFPHCRSKATSKRKDQTGPGYDRFSLAYPPQSHPIAVASDLPLRVLALTANRYAGEMTSASPHSDDGRTQS
jgi:hypothetical protein